MILNGNKLDPLLPSDKIKKKHKIKIKNSSKLLILPMLLPSLALLILSESLLANPLPMEVFARDISYSLSKSNNNSNP